MSASAGRTPETKLHIEGATTTDLVPADTLLVQTEGSGYARPQQAPRQTPTPPATPSDQPTISSTTLRRE
jgi:hypothetical protein